MKKLILLITILLMPSIASAQTAEEYIEKGNTKFRDGYNYGAIQDYNKAIQLDPYNYDAYRRRAIAKAGGIDYKSAMRDFNKVIELDPKNAKEYIYRGLLDDPNNTPLQFYKFFLLVLVPIGAVGACFMWLLYKLGFYRLLDKLVE